MTQISRVARGPLVDSLESDNVKSGAQRSEGLDRLEKIRGGDSLEFSLSGRCDLHAEEEYWHRVFRLQNQK